MIASWSTKATVVSKWNAPCCASTLRTMASICGPPRSKIGAAGLPGLAGNGLRQPSSDTLAFSARLRNCDTTPVRFSQ